MQNIQNKKLINTIYSNVMHRIKIYRWNHKYIRTVHVKIIFVDFNKQNSIYFFFMKIRTQDVFIHLIRNVAFTTSP